MKAILAQYYVWNFNGQLMMPISGIREYSSGPSTSKSFVFSRMTRMTVSMALFQMRQ